AFNGEPERFDLVITDFVMPGINGQQVCDAVRKCSPDCPIIVYSAYQPEEMDFRKFEPVRFLEKPFEPALLATTVAQLLGPART
ncbi:MAG TPA: response regulator, partial [Rhizobiales bacterium]|nr:response regulator [Hyphomicrobiales bacterium]